jgi:2-polyprenyl-3-methyl-5-hydroxy-6-metoxy-1,4-benzoquinol methylase
MRDRDGSDRDGHERQRLNEEARRAWDANAATWDQTFGTLGNSWHRVLVAPSIGRLLALKPGERVLDLACGNGHVARWLAGMGARVVAGDFSERMVAHARERLSDLKDVEVLQLDATNPRDLARAGATGPFDAVLCNMALMDIADIEPLARVLPELLRPAGRFVFSVLHPSFHAPGVRLCMEEEERDGAVVEEYHVKLRRYATPDVTRGCGIRAQPAPQLYFHRPLALLTEPFFRAGLSLNALEEPTLPPGTEAMHPLSWVHFRDLPPVLSARLVLRG